MRQSVNTYTLLTFLTILTGVIVALVFIFLSDNSSRANPEPKESLEIENDRVYELGSTYEKSNQDQSETNIVQLTGNNIESIGTVKIEAIIAISLLDGSMSDSGSGLVFENWMEGQNYKRIRLFYYQLGRSWTLEYYGQQKPTYFHIGNQDLSDLAISARFEISISEDGKSVRVGDQKGDVKTFNLPDSLYNKGNDMRISAMVSPLTKIRIAKLKITVDDEK